MRQSQDPSGPLGTSGNSAKLSKQLVPFLCGIGLVALALGMDVTLCPTAGLFGIPCPSCGLTRATTALLSGEIRRAHVAHPAVLPVLTYLGAAAFALAGRPSFRIRRVVCAIGVMLVLGLVLLWGARFAGAFAGPTVVERWW